MSRAINKLTALKVKNIKYSETDSNKHADGGGMYLLADKNDSKYWRMDYRRPVTGKRNTLALGVYPEVSLELARKRRDEARIKLAEGIDPAVAQQTQAEKALESSKNTFKIVASEWLAKRVIEKKDDVETLRRLTHDVYPVIGHRPIADITAQEILKDVLQPMLKREVYDSTQRVLRLCGQVLRYAVVTERAAFDPTQSLRGALPSPAGEHFPAITDDPKQLGQLLLAMDQYHGTVITRYALKLVPYLFLRPSGIQNAEWTEFLFEENLMSIPKERMKKREDLLTPLPHQAVSLLKELHSITGRGKYLFPHRSDPSKTISENTLNKALAAKGYKGIQTIHGFRATARTMIDEKLRIREDFVNHQLAHKVKDPTGRSYNRTKYLDDRREMMQIWADYLDTLKAVVESGVDTYIPKFSEFSYENGD